jgi:hypothetical protein
MDLAGVLRVAAYERTLGDLRAAANEVFATLSTEQHAWARDFVLQWSDDRAGNLSALSNDAAAACADAGVTNILVTPPVAAEDAPHGMPIAAIHSSFALIPAWSQGGVTVGVAMERLKSLDGITSLQCLPQPGQPHMDALGRFARHEETGELLIVRTASETLPGGSRPSIALVCHFLNLSTTRQKHTSIHCDFEQLAARPKVPASFAETAVSCEVSFHEHDCSVCHTWKGDETFGGCGCSLALNRPSSSIDFSEFQTNGKHLYTECTGSCAIYMRPLGETADPFQMFQLLAATSTRQLSGKERLQFVTSLRELAIRQQLSKSFACRGIPSTAAAALQSFVETMDADLFASSEPLGETAAIQWPSSDAPTVINVSDQKRSTSCSPRRECFEKAASTAAHLEKQRRNKASAARSNQRRKERTQQLQTTLDEIRLKEGVLRAKYAAVAADNAVLKSRAANAWVSGVKSAL